MSKVFVYSRGEYNSLGSSVRNRPTIRIHNIADRNFYPHYEEDKLVLFFNDEKIMNLSLWRMFKSFWNLEDRCLNKKMTIEILDYLRKNKGKDIIVHCEYGQSRSVAVAMFLRDYYGYSIVNKKEEELTKYNDWVLMLLKRYN